MGFEGIANHDSYNFGLLFLLTLSLLFLFQITVIIDQKSSIQQLDFISLGSQLQFLKLLPNIWGRLSNKMLTQEGKPFSRDGISVSILPKGLL
jgi:hypothetical protein